MTRSEFYEYVKHGKLSYQTDMFGKKKRAKPESIMQQACVIYFLSKYPQYKGLLFAIPNGGDRHILVAMNLKSEGVVAGVPDLFLSIPRGGFHGMYLEAKIKPNSLSDKQLVMMHKFKQQGYKAVVFWTFYEFVHVIDEYMNLKE